MRHPKSDAKIDRIVVSWLHPTRGNATWLAAVADEVSLPPGLAHGTDRFCYITLEPAAESRTASTGWANPNTTAPRTMLVIDDRHRPEAARRIPALNRAWNPRTNEVDEPHDHVVVELRPVDRAARHRHRGWR